MIHYTKSIFLNLYTNSMDNILSFIEVWGFLIVAIIQAYALIKLIRKVCNYIFHFEYFIDDVFYNLCFRTVIYISYRLIV